MCLVVITQNYFLKGGEWMSFYPSSKMPPRTFTPIDQRRSTASWFDLFSSSTARKYHGFILLAIVLDFATIALSAISMRRSIRLSSSGGGYWSAFDFLPIAGSIIGTVIAAVNGMAVAQLVTAYARIAVTEEGLTFRKWGHLHSLGKCHIYTFN